MKLQQLIDEGKVEDKNKTADGKIKIGYVGAYPYAEVVSGYTAFFLGLQSIVPDVAMQVQYTNSWFNITAENEAAKALIADGCIIVSQHADSTGAPAACQEALDAGTTVYCVGYNVDMLAVAPTAALTSPTNVWEVFYEYAFNAVMNGETFDQNWCQAMRPTPLPSLRSASPALPAPRRRLTRPSRPSRTAVCTSSIPASSPSRATTTN